MKTLKKKKKEQNYIKNNVPIKCKENKVEGRVRTKA